MGEPLAITLPAPLASVRALPSADDGEGAALARMQEALEGERAALARARAALEMAAGSLGEIETAARAEAEANVVDLAVAIARKILATEIDAGRYDAAALVREALAKAPPGREVVVQLAPADLERYESASREGPACANLRVVADAGVRPGECIVRTAEGTVESRIEDGLDRAAEALQRESS